MRKFLKHSRVFKAIRALKLWQHLLITILLVLLSSLFLRRNYQQMISLRDAVVEQDESEGDIGVAVKNLGDYVISHMNTNLPGPVQLPYSFNRDYDQLVRNSQVPSDDYLAIREKCVTFDVPVEVQSECIRSEASAITDSDVSLSPELYSFDFKSPAWSPDLAGWFSVISLLSMLTLVVRFLTDRVVKALLKNHR